VAECFQRFEKTGSGRKIFQKINGTRRVIFQENKWNSIHDLPEKNWLTTRDG
jgi:hypothetical protein